MFVFGGSQLEKEAKANMLNCALGNLPLNYLGIPISDSHLGMGAFSPIIQKIINRLDPKHITSGGRQILTNSCLSSIPIYFMGFYWLTDGFHGKMDSARANFLWQGAGNRFKYHMAKWEMVSGPKTREVWALSTLDS